MHGASRDKNSVEPTTEHICALGSVQAKEMCEMALLAVANTVLPHLQTLPPIPIDNVSNLILLQVALHTSTRDDAILLEQRVIDPTDPFWTFYGWTMVFDWAMQNREVVCFDGDVGPVTLVSKLYESTLFYPGSLDVPHGVVRSIKYVVVYVSVVLGAVALVMLVYDATSFASTTWSVPFVSVASSSLPAVFSMPASVHLVAVDTLTYLDTLSPRSFVATCVVVGDASWIVYVIHDLLAALMKYHAYYAAPVSTAVAFLLVAILELRVPVDATVDLARPRLAYAGRPLLFLRGVVATRLLSTSPLELRQAGALGLVTAFHVDALEWNKVVLAAADVVWLVYVVADVLSVATKQHTTTVAGASGSLWLIASILTLSAPSHTSPRSIASAPSTTWTFSPRATPAPFTLAARGGYFVARARAAPPQSHRSLLLSPTARYVFDLEPWTLHGVVFLDKASAAITGLLSIQHDHTFYVLHVKLWRDVVLQVPHDCHVPTTHPLWNRVRYAVPLVLHHPRAAAGSTSQFISHV
ncbi:Aste57867_24263 [Aphanomyces stellatus]|uniref:Aste57867_24263 protein n=1 Tax=Aphanomyces stellatus TaxID=120398 RepID=A0A485LR27_9STRA|nr:hypothetical protein As57867_024188 [Aphanomyces stellatus]VFU00903.1 Aste57867_24263 [Aphanomyces stellatus]